MSILQKSIAELIGTFWLVLGGCGSAVLAAKFFFTDAEGTPFNLGIGLVGVSLAFGLTLLTMVYTIGHISGCHINPAVSVGLWIAGRFPSSQLVPYILSQVVGATLAAAVLFFIASGSPDFEATGNFLAANGYGESSPGGYNLWSALVAEVVLTFFFLLVILGATDARSPQGFAGVPIGLALTLIHLISIPVTNTSVNPARSTGPAIFVGGAALGQLWLFWVAPIVGALLAGLVYRWLAGAARAATSASPVEA
jgi:aquaporin Z